MQILLLTDAEDQFNKAKDLLALLLTRRRGEFLMRIGAQPPRDVLLSNKDLSGTGGWEGMERTEEEITRIKVSLRRATEELGGKVGISGWDSCWQVVIVK